MPMMPSPGQPLPPMFATITGSGDPCRQCHDAGRGTIKVLLASGVQACRFCDAG